MPSLNPSPAQLAEFAARMPAGQPIMMLNLLRYNATASYPAGSEHSACTGREAYKRYSRTAIAKVQGVGGRVEILAPVQVALIAPTGEAWDEMLLVRYPSPEAFLSMINDPEYQAATVHRTAALFDSRLIGTTPPA